jgi:hypothetical protein
LDAAFLWKTRPPAGKISSVISCLYLPIITAFQYVVLLIVVTALESEIVILGWKHWLGGGFMVIIIISLLIWWLVGPNFEGI